MIAYWDIIQGTPDWHAIRYGKVGGSTSNGLFVNSNTLLDEVLSARLEPFENEEDSYMNADMTRGYEMEPLARFRLGQYVNVEFLECGWLQCEEIPLLGISPDGISKDLKTMCEIKCPNRKKHTTTIREGVTPLEHNAQLLHNFTVNPHLETLYFASFRPESIKQLFVEKFDMDSLINMGTKAKPIVKPVHEWVLNSKASAKVLSAKVEAEIDKINSL